MNLVDAALQLVADGHLAIDANGGVWRTARVWRSGTHPARVTKREPRRIENTMRRGYLRFTFSLGGESLTVLAHRVVWAHFNGPIPDGMEINHKNGIKTDNRPENLELTTRAGNMLHAYATGLKYVLGGEHNHRAKISDEMVREIRRRVRSGERRDDVAASLGLCKASISHIMSGRTWSHVPDDIAKEAI